MVVIYFVYIPTLHKFKLLYLLTYLEMWDYAHFMISIQWIFIKSLNESDALQLSVDLISPWKFTFLKYQYLCKCI